MDEEQLDALAEWDGVEYDDESFYEEELEE